MAAKELFWETVDQAYEDDGIIHEYVDDPGVDHGDGLAEFIVRELSDCAIGDPIGLEEAARRMERAEIQLSNVAAALRRMAEDAEEASGQ